MNSTNETGRTNNQMNLYWGIVNLLEGPIGLSVPNYWHLASWRTFSLTEQINLKKKSLYRVTQNHLYQIIFKFVPSGHVCAKLFQIRLVIVVFPDHTHLLFL